MYRARTLPLFILRTGGEHFYRRAPGRIIFSPVRKCFLMRACAYDKAFKRADICQNYREHALAKKFLCMRRMSKILRAPCPVILYAACGNDIYFAPAQLAFLSHTRPIACLSHADGIEIYCAPAKPILSRRACTEIFSPARAASVILSHAPNTDNKIAQMR